MEIIGMILALWAVFGLLLAVIISIELSFRPDECKSYWKYIFIIGGGPIVWIISFFQYLFDKNPA